MRISILMRLTEEALVDGRLCGPVEIVETGERAVVRDVTELLAFVNGSIAQRNGSAAVDTTDGGTR